MQVSFEHNNFFVFSSRIRFYVHGSLFSVAWTVQSRRSIRVVLEQNFSSRLRFIDSIGDCSVS